MCDSNNLNTFLHFITHMVQYTIDLFARVYCWLTLVNVSIHSIIFNTCCHRSSFLVLDSISYHLFFFSFFPFISQFRCSPVQKSEQQSLTIRLHRSKCSCAIVVNCIKCIKCFSSIPFVVNLLL